MNDPLSFNTRPRVISGLSVRSPRVKRSLWKDWLINLKDIAPVVSVGSGVVTVIAAIVLAIHFLDIGEPPAFDFSKAFGLIIALFFFSLEILLCLLLPLSPTLILRQIRPMPLKWWYYLFWSLLYYSYQFISYLALYSAMHLIGTNFNLFQSYSYVWLITYSAISFFINWSDLSLRSTKVSTTIAFAVMLLVSVLLMFTTLIIPRFPFKALHLGYIDYSQGELIVTQEASDRIATQFQSPKPERELWGETPLQKARQWYRITNYNIMLLDNIGAKSILQITPPKYPRNTVYHDSRFRILISNDAIINDRQIKFYLSKSFNDKNKKISPKPTKLERQLFWLYIWTFVGSILLFLQNYILKITSWIGSKLPSKTKTRP
jgi:hypothetical protein